MKTKFTRTGENEIKFEDLSIENARFALSRNFEYLRGWLEDGTNYYSLRRFGKINVVKRMARSAGVKRNWSVLYVSYLQAIEGEGKGKVRRLRPVYKRYVVYRCRAAWEDQGERSEDR